jgi:predicted transposase/invertase (TIGR01784 family)
LSLAPQSAEAIPELKEAYAQAAMNTWSQEELDVYEYWQIRDAADRYGLEAKFDNGKAEGKIEGKLEGTMAVARNMLGIGLSVEVIMQTTGLSREQIAELTA